MNIKSIAILLTTFLMMSETLCAQEEKAVRVAVYDYLPMVQRTKSGDYQDFDNKHAGLIRADKMAQSFIDLSKKFGIKPIIHYYEGSIELLETLNAGDLDAIVFDRTASSVAGSYSNVKKLR